jgi:3-methyladenine DNA glycosylase Tag
MKSFAEISERAAKNAGGEAELEARLPTPESAAALRKIADDRYLSTMSLRVFAAGLRHSMVRDKWPAFEEVFQGFVPGKVASFSDEALEALMKDSRIIRHWGKISATRANAIAMTEIAAEHGSFANWLADWPTEDAAGLWEVLQKKFSQLGGMSGPMFLRWVGKDTFMLSPDVVRALNDLGVAKSEFKGKRDRRIAQDAFNVWRDESGLALCQISMTLAIFTGVR